MRIVTAGAVRILGSIELIGGLPSFRIFRRDSYNVKVPFSSSIIPPDEYIGEFRLNLLACINNNPGIARNIKFTALYWLTENPYISTNTGLQNLYAEILASDLELMTQFDDRVSSLVVLATVFERIPLLQILKRYNAPMAAVIPAEVCGDVENFYQFDHVHAGETAVYAYLRMLANRMDSQDGEYSYYDPSIIAETSHQVMGILWDRNCTREQMKQLLPHIKSGINGNKRWVSQAFDFMLAHSGMLTFVAPRTIRSHNGVFNAPTVLRDFLDKSGDDKVLSNIYDFLRPTPRA